MFIDSMAFGVMRTFWKIRILVFGSLFLSVAAQLCCSATEETDAFLFRLNPLPKIHYSFGLPNDLLTAAQGRCLYELARITHALSVSGDYITSDKLNLCVYTCARVNKTKPDIPASIGVNFSPWYKKFGKELPPTNRGPSYKAEIEYFENRLTLIKKWIEKSNQKYGSNVKVSAIILDCERFHSRADDKKWNEGMRQALDAIHIKASSIFPKARIEWYGRGMSVVSAGDGWKKGSYFTGKEIMPTLSCSLYCLAELERMHETYRRTADLAGQLGIEDVTPWVALASGYRRGLKKTFYWDKDWDYNLIYSHIIGRELNIPWYGQRPKRFAPFNRVKVIIFYPAPFDKRTPGWTKHFIAYVRGATGVKDLSDLGYDR